jgi:hypothetical protein
MLQRRWVTAALASVTVLLASGGLLGMSAPAAIAGSAAVAGPAAATSRALSSSSITFPDLVSQAPVKWTPNVFAGSLSCNPQWFGPGNRLCKHHTIYSQAVVNGEVVVVGAFTQVCQTGPAASGHCAPGTLVTRNAWTTRTSTRPATPRCRSTPATAATTSAGGYRSSSARRR